VKFLGFLLCALGFLLAALVTVQTEADEIVWRLFVPALAVSVAGAIINQRAVRRAKGLFETVERDTRTLEESLGCILERLGEIEGQPGARPEVHHRIDALLRDPLDRFVEARHSLAHCHGLSAYAGIMNEFAAGERYLNRVWSASVDGYVDEVQEYLVRARVQFTAAQDKLHNLLRPTAPGSLQG
jgi:hypothetical protein